MLATDSYQTRKKYLYQFANGLASYFVFPCTELDIKTSGDLKTNYTNNRLRDGLINLSVSEKFRKGAYVYTVTFLIKNTDLFDVDYVKSVFWNGYKQLAFFYDLDSNSNMSFYYNILTVTKSFLEDYSSTESLNQGPFLFGCDTTIAYFDKSAYVINERKWDELLWDSGKFDPGIALSTIAISTLTLQQKLDLFFRNVDNDNALVYTDKFFNPTTYTTGANLVVNLTKAGSVLLLL